SCAMRKGYWIVLASQAELVTGILLASYQPPSILNRSVDDIALATMLAYIPTALVGGVVVAEEKGYHYLVGFFLGLFSIPGLMLLALLPPHMPTSAPREDGDNRNGPRAEGCP